MRINNIGNCYKPNFGGKISVPDYFKPINITLDTDKITKFERRRDNVLIHYDASTGTRNYTIDKEPRIVRTNLEFNTLMNIYNAAKNSDLVIEMNK